MPRTTKERKANEGKCGDAKDDKGKEGKCGEGKCGERTTKERKAAARVNAGVPKSLTAAGSGSNEIRVLRPAPRIFRRIRS